MVPLAPLAEWLGVKVQVQEDLIAAGTDLSRPRLLMRLDHEEARLEGKPWRMSPPPFRRGDTIFVPLRQFAECFGAWVSTEDRIIRIAVPHKGLSAEMATPPASASLMGKAWKIAAWWFGLQKIQGLDSWDVFSERCKQRMVKAVGVQAPRIVRREYPLQDVAGVRILSDGLDLSDRTAWIVAVLRRTDGRIHVVRLELLLTRSGWRIDRVVEEP